MGKHTPGPWSVTPTKHPVADTFGVEARGVWVAKCHPFNGDWPGRDEAKANANLIAAAPDLLDALEQIVYAQEHMNTDDDTVALHGEINAAKQTIAKAKGE